MMKMWVKLTVTAFLLTSLTGCWDLKTIQDTNYMTAIGFDYKDGKYIVYGQMLDFASVAKQEGGQSAQLPLIWVGKEEGGTVSEAFNKLYRTSQQRVFWGHVGAYLFSKNALNQGIGKFTDGNVRYSETRFTQWFYSTDEPIEDIFSVIPFFNVSPMSSILMQPTESFRQRSDIAPHRLFWVASRLREPGYTVMLPTLDIVDKVWSKNKKPDPKLRVNGVYALNKHRSLQWFSEEEFVGARWLNTDTIRTPMVVYREGRAVHNVIIKPKAHIKIRADGEKTFFDVDVIASSTIAEIYEEVGEAELKKLIANQVKEEIEQTFKLGKSSGIDAYGLEHILYRDEFATWAKLTAYGEKPLSDYELGTILVKPTILHSGMLKTNIKQTQY
ncbi:Ger(x)C family spore germination protein [Paenibacillus qinlingensis]|uniref:Ger(x)C family spore germination protein n=1 Tax=Paenibacillus qinlingensis TaxID=1837343 RepID=UPI001566B4A7|nr:Ger(x)C family spore germination protein [Paenibacillus qinlingensis]NQX60162.1 Ger(x)C family spore germination protein [Paenibacillus qinlingensis]